MPETPPKTPEPRVIHPEVWYETDEVCGLLGGKMTPRNLRRLPIPRTPLKRGSDLYKGSDLLAFLESRGGQRSHLRRVS